MKTLLERLARFARHRYRAIFVVFGVLAAISIALITRLSFDTDMLNLLPRRDPAVGAYVETLQDFGSQTFLLITISIPEGRVPDPYESLADDLAARLSKLPGLKNVQHRIGDPVELLQTFFPKSLLFLDAPGRERLAAKLQDDAIRQRVSELRRQISTPQALAVKELARYDPLGLSEVFLGRLESSRGTLNVDWTSGYYLSRDHQLLLILAEPTQPPQNIKFIEGLAKSVDGAIAESLSKWDEIAGPEPPPRPEVRLGGPHLTALGDASLIRNDMIVNIATSAIGVFLLFLFAFRRIGALLYAFVPLLGGLVLTFGFAALAFGALSSATSVVAALLIGLGIDFVIVSYARYIEVRRNGGSLEQALKEMLGSCGPAVMAGAITTAATFYAFTFTDFTGLRQLGLLTGTGILLCMTSVLVLLPAMLAWSEDHHLRRKTEPRLYLHSFGTNRLTAVCMRHPVTALLIGMALTVAALGLAFRIEFDESMRTMRPTGNRGIEVAENVGKHFGSGFDSMILIIRGKTLEEVLALSDKAAEGAKRLVSQGVLYGYSGPTSLIPPREHQREALDWLARERASGGLDLDRIRATFASAAADEGLRVEPFEPGFDLLTRAVSLTRPIGLEDFASTQQTKLLLDRYLKKKEDGWKAAVYLYPPANRWRREPPPQAVKLAERLGPQVRLSGVNVINQRVRAMVLRDAWIAGILGYFLVAAILWVDFRNLRFVVLALTPLMVGITLMIGGMVLFDIQMNFINIFVTTMIIGIGVDYGIYILHRYSEMRGLPEAELEQGLRETGKAVMAAAVSTIVGFGSIIFSHYPGLRSTGKVAILGALFTSLVATMLLPAYLVWRERAKRKAA
ncbi:MAG TPA: MMPL family transporter [Thermoanaerobaculia bacterium]|nr:MMPL family transporter [Thermoanaerobaculia bacterium]